MAIISFTLPCIIACIHSKQQKQQELPLQQLKDNVDSNIVQSLINKSSYQAR